MGTLFTKELKYKGKGTIPPKALRWRMKAPILYK